jgi:hypothetical protein
MRKKGMEIRAPHLLRLDVHFTPCFCVVRF